MKFSENMTLKKLYDMLLQDIPSKMIHENEEQLFDMIPELKECKNFLQNNIWHIYDVYEHILHVVDQVPANLTLRLAALFHDIGKPYVYTEDENGVGHFYHHWTISKQIFDKFAEKHGIDDKTKETVSKLILYHDINIEKLTIEQLDELVSSFHKNEIIKLFQLKKADLLAQNTEFHYLLENYKKQEIRILTKYKKKSGVILWQVYLN